MLARVMAASVQPTRPIQASMQVGVFVCTLTWAPMQAVWQALTKPLQPCSASWRPSSRLSST